MVTNPTYIVAIIVMSLSFVLAGQSVFLKILDTMNIHMTAITMTAIAITKIQE